jgi:hypothetical protein
VSKTVEQFAQDFGAKRLFVFRKGELTKSEITMVYVPTETIKIHNASVDPIDISGQPVYAPPKAWEQLSAGVLVFKSEADKIKYKRRRR